MFFFTLGLVIGIGRSQMLAAPVLKNEFGPSRIAGRVLSVEPKDGRYRLLLDRLEMPRLKGDVPERVRISITSVPPRAGERIAIAAKLMPPSGPVTPGGFDFARMAWFQQLGGVGYAVGDWEPLPLTQPPGLMAALKMEINSLRQSIAQRIGASLPGEAGAIASALLAGIRGQLQDQTWQAFRDSGIAHLLAISGLHMGLVVGLAFVGMRRIVALFPALALRVDSKKITAFLSLIVASGYLLISGGAISAQRAFIMVALMLLAVMLDRHAISLRLVAWAAMIILIFQPESLINPGLQMSFAAVIALVAVYEQAGGKIRRFVFGDYFHSRGLLARYWRIVALYVIGIILTTIIAGLSTAPFAAMSFNRLANYGLIANLLTVPLIGAWIMPLGLLALLLMPLGMEAVPLQAMGWGIEWMLQVAGWVAATKGAVVWVPAMPNIAIALICLGGLWIAIWRRAPRWLGAPFVLLGLLLPWQQPPPDVLLDGKGKLLAFYNGDGVYAFADAKGERWTISQWLHRYQAAEDRINPAHRLESGYQSPDGTINCGPEGCLLARNGKMVSFPKSPQAFREDCTVADVILLTLLPRASANTIEACGAGNTQIIDRDYLKHQGALAIWLGRGEKPLIKSVRSESGVRPWLMY